MAFEVSATHKWIVSSEFVAAPKDDGMIFIGL